MSDEQTLAEKQAAQRVSKASWINDQVYNRLHQDDVQPGVKSAPDAREVIAPKTAPRKRKVTETP